MLQFWEAVWACTIDVSRQDGVRTATAMTARSGQCRSCGGSSGYTDGWMMSHRTPGQLPNATHPLPLDRSVRDAARNDLPQYVRQVAAVLSLLRGLAMGTAPATLGSIVIKHQRYVQNRQTATHWDVSAGQKLFKHSWLIVEVLEGPRAQSPKGVAKSSATLHIQRPAIKGRSHYAAYLLFCQLLPGSHSGT
jgi:hypothetical protein